MIQCHLKAPFCKFIKKTLYTTGFVCVLFFTSPELSLADTTTTEILSEQMIATPVQEELRIYDSFVVNHGSTVPFTLHLPNGFKNVQVPNQSNAGYQITQDGITWKTGLPSGQTSVTVLYTLPYDNGRADIDFSKAYSIDSLQLFIPEGQTTLIAQGIYPITQVVDFAGQKFRKFTKLGVAAGSPWSASVQQIPTAGQANPLNIPVPAGVQTIGSGYKYTEFKAFINILLVAFVLILGIFGLRKRRTKINQQILHMRDTYMHQWAELELKRRQHHVTEDEYVRLRAMYLRRLLVIERIKTGVQASD